MDEAIRKLRDAKDRAKLGGGREKIEQVHQGGKLTARERIDRILDAGSFVEWNMLGGHLAGTPGDGILAGYGAINGRTVCIYSQDRTVVGGSIGNLHGHKMYSTIEKSLEMKVPLIGLNDSPGMRAPDEQSITSGVRFENRGQAVFFPNTQASGVIPQISAILGACAGIAVYSPALTDFVFMVDGISQMFITGPRVVKSVLGEEVTAEDLGGAKVHSRVSGVADFRLKSEDECFQTMRRLLSFLPSNHEEMSPVANSEDPADRLINDFAEVVPVEPSKAYDVRKVIKRLVDNGDFLEVKAEFAPEMVVGFGRLDGHSVGIVANQPLVRAGALTIDSSDKQARFIRFCDCFNIPLVLLVDTPAYLPGSQQERGGIIRHGAKVLYALCEATVPRIVVVLRKAYGGGTLAMGVLPGMGTDFVYYWPIAEAGIMGAEQSVDLLFGKQIRVAPDPVAFKAEKVREYREKYANPLFRASTNPYVDDVIEPAETRKVLASALRFLRSKRVNPYPKKHGNIPL